MALMANLQVPNPRIIPLNTADIRWVVRGGNVHLTICQENEDKPLELTTQPSVTILPTVPLPQTCIQSIVSSSSDVSKPPRKVDSDSNKKVGADPCVAPIATHSMKELRLKGSSFLRTHASKHGIANASRKLTAQVTLELAKHYQLVHKIDMVKDEHSEAPITNIGRKPNKKLVAITEKQLPIHQLPTQQLPTQQQTQNLIPRLPQHPVPLAPPLFLSPQIYSEPQQEVPLDVSLKTGMEKSGTMRKPKVGSSPSETVSRCRSGILAKSRAELATCGTSLLRPEAAAHKVHNASRKPKEVVVDELWSHYMQCHQKDIIKSGESGGWVGSVIDDEDEEPVQKN